MGKALRILMGFVFILLLQSCDYGILYDNPQPLGLNNLKSFPDYYIGNYRNDSSKVTVVISTNKIIKITDYDITASKAEIDTMNDCKLTGDSLYMADLNQKVHVVTTSDSVFGIFSSPDTIFSLSGNNILRKYKRDCFLNLAHKSGLWQVVKLSELKDKYIEFSIITQKVDTNKLKNLTAIKPFIEEGDSVATFQINPTHKELKAMIKAGLFDKTEKYRKLPTAL